MCGASCPRVCICTGTSFYKDQIRGQKGGASSERVSVEASTLTLSHLGLPLPEIKISSTTAVLPLLGALRTGLEIHSGACLWSDGTRRLQLCCSPPPTSQRGMWVLLPQAVEFLACCLIPKVPSEAKESGYSCEGCDAPQVSQGEGGGGQDPGAMEGTPEV